MTRIQNRRATTAEWAAANPVLAAGEFGLNTTLGEVKIGDGSTHWSALPYGPTKSTVEINLREWTGDSALPNDGNSDCNSLFIGVINDLAAKFTETGMRHSVIIPGGDYAFGGPNAIIPPKNKPFGIVGEDRFAVTLRTPATSALFGSTMDYNYPDAPFDWHDILLANFTIDGSAVPIETSYTALYKGISFQNVKDFDIRDLRIVNTFATSMGLDYCTGTVLNPIVENGGRGRVVATSVVADRFGSGAGLGFGWGNRADDVLKVYNPTIRGCGSAGVFVERLNYPYASYNSEAVQVFGGVAEGCAYGVNDAGGDGARFDGMSLRRNLYAGFRAGNSDPWQPGGRNGVATGLRIFGNLHGAVFEGAAGESYDFHHNEVARNAANGVYYRDRDKGLIGRRVRNNNNHIHHNGGPGIFGDSSYPISELDVGSNVIHDNGVDPTSTYRHEVCFAGPTARVSIKHNTIRAANGYAIALMGSGTVSDAPQIQDNDLAGSAGGALLLQQAISDKSGIKNNTVDKSSTVTQGVVRPTPQVTTGWSGSVNTRTFENTGGPTVRGVTLAWHIKGVTTAAAPRLWGPGTNVTPGDSMVVSAYVKGDVLGKRIQLSVRFDNGTPVDGAVDRTTGDWKRLDMPIVVPTGAVQMQVGVKGVTYTDTSTWDVGDVMRMTGVNQTVGSFLWPYIDGTQPNCAWAGTAFASTSVLTIPASTIINENSIFDPDSLTDGEATMPRYAVTSASISSSSSGTGRFTYMTAQKTETISKVRTISGTALPADATLAKIGVWDVDPVTELPTTLLAVTANEEATLWATANTEYVVNLLTPFTKIKGKRYAIEFLWVGPTAGMTYQGQNWQAAELAHTPRLAATKPSLTDVVQVTFTSVSDFGGRIYAVLLP